MLIQQFINTIINLTYKPNTCLFRTQKLVPVWFSYNPRNEVVGGYTGFTMSVHPSVRPSVPPSVDKSYVV
jgi:hypothetical protein